jgi:hypothetical protein
MQGLSVNVKAPMAIVDSHIVQPHVVVFTMVGNVPLVAGIAVQALMDAAQNLKDRALKEAGENWENAPLIKGPTWAEKNGIVT